MSSSLWIATQQLVVELRRSSAIQNHIVPITVWKSARETGPVVAAIANARMGDQFENRPLLAGFVLGYADLFGPLSKTPEGTQWGMNAELVALAFGRIVEWFRSRLPRYPRLLAPQIDSRSNRTQPSGYIFGPGAPWILELRNEGLEHRDLPDVSALSLPGTAAALHAAISGLSDQIRSTPEWTRFQDADRALSDSDIAQLRLLRRDYRSRTSDAALDTIEPFNLKRRHSVREAALRATLETAQGPAAAYLDAFRAIDNLISTLVRVIEQAVTFGPPASVGGAVEGVWRPTPGGYRVRLSAKTTTGMPMRTGLVEISSEVERLAGVVVVEELTVSFDGLVDSEEVVMTGTLLASSASIFA